MGTLDAVTDGVVVVDADGAEVVRNLAAERFRNARHGDALVSQVIDELLEAARQGEGAVERELSLFGPPREVLVIRAVPLRNSREVVGAAAFVGDITEGRRTESVRRDFVANVSHELKTPIGALGLLAETIASSDDLAVVAPLADQLVREAHRLSRIVDDLLDLSLIEAQEAPNRERVELRVLLDEVADRLAPMALAHGIPLHVADVPEALVLECDPAQIISAVTNLLDNAVKYSDLGQRVEVGAHDDGQGHVVITVQDRGIGIPALELERIFERFYRVDKARSRATGGTGLGLSIVRHAVYAHGGQVSVTSVEGEGSTFELVLPASSLRS
jgi:two-component system sensor histidine kinase SenX3